MPHKTIPEYDMVEVDDVTITKSEETVKVRLPFGDTVYEIDGSGYLTIFHGKDRLKKINPFSSNAVNW